MTLSLNNPRYGNIFVVADTFAELRSLSTEGINGGDCAILAGALARGDGQGGVFVWIGDATDADDDQSAVAPSNGQAGRWKRANPAVVAGMDGVSPSITAVTASTLAPGSSANAVITPLGGNNYSIAFGIPTANATVADGSVSTAKLASLAVTSDKIAATGTSVGTFGSSSTVPVLTVNAKGQITAANSVALSAVAQSNFALASDVRTGTSNSTVTTPKALFDASNSVLLADAATITPDFATGWNFHVTLAGNRTLANPINQIAGQSGRIRVTQDSTGSRTLAFGGAWKFPGGAPTLSTANSTVDVLAYFVHANGSIEASAIKALS